MRYPPKITATLQLRAASAVADSPTLWAIENYLPCHHLSAIVAPTGAGLTTLAAQICAHLAPAPKSEIENRQSEIPRVLVLPGRESPYSTRDRLLAAGVDLSQVLIVEDVHEEYIDDHSESSTRRPVCASDHRQISSLLHEHKSIRLILIDNAEDLFTAANRPSRNKLLRQLSCWQQVAESREVAITFLTAIPSLQRDPFRSTFLSALHHVSRAIYLLAPAPDENPDPKIENEARVLFTIKNTLAAPSTLRLTDSFSTSQPLALSYRAYLAALRAPSRPGPAPDSRNYAIEFLREILKPGQKLIVGRLRNPARGTIHYLIQQAGLSVATVTRAKEQLGITSTRDRNRWYWHHPDAAQEPQLAAAASADPRTSAPPLETCDSSRKSAHSEPPPPPSSPLIQSHLPPFRKPLDVIVSPLPASQPSPPRLGYTPL